MIHQRTMEIFRTVGVEQIVTEKSGEQFDQDGAIMSAESLAGKEIAWYIANLNEKVRDVSPCTRVFITQSLLEPLLQRRAAELGARLRFSTDMTSFGQDAGGVTATIRHRESGAVETVRAQYMVGADGSRSPVREALGIRLQGRGVFSSSITIYFRAVGPHTFAPLMRGRNLSVIMVVNPKLRGFFRIEKPYTSGFLAVHTVGDPAHPETDVSKDLTEERCLEYVRCGLGVDDIPIKIENLMYWQSTADIAERFTDGRVFLAGDAAHVMPPYGGFGGNTGIADAQNLAWKLALVLQGKASPRLLDTYQDERRPAAAFTVEQAYSRYVTRAAQYLGAGGMQPLEDDLNIELGYCYHSGAVVPEGANQPAHENPRDSKGRPGTRAPHVWLEQDGRRISTLDLFGKNFVLLAGPAGAAWSNHLDAARKLIDLDFHPVGAGQLADPDNAFLAAYGISAQGASLIRPDGFVAWRAQEPCGITGVLRSIL